MPSIYTPQFGNTYCPQLRMDVSEQSSTGATVTYAWSLYYVAHGYAASTGGVAKNYWVSFGDSVVKSGSFNINGITGTAGITSGTIVMNRAKSPTTMKFGCSMDFNITWHGVYGGNKAANGSFTIPQKSSWTLKFNANGGTGAPGSMTKWYGENLTIPSTKPTRTGYIFQGWGKTTTTVNYAPGAAYGEDGNITLYAVWKAVTYTVKYNANGGSGAPGNQTKTYGVALTLSSTRPTRTNYNFVGWGTSSSSTTPSYQPGGSYVANAAITLYAIWSLAYTRPRITNVSIDRCLSDGTLSEEGTYALVKFNWATDKTVTEIRVYCGTLSTNASGSGTSGSVSLIFGNNSFSTESSYLIQISVSDSNGSNLYNYNLPPLNYVIDFYAGGKGVAFGKPAEMPGADFGENVYIRNGFNVVHGYSDDPQAPVRYSACLTNYRSNYWGICGPNSDLDWVRSPKNGFLPYEPSVSNIGAESWPFNTGYFGRILLNFRNQAGIMFWNSNYSTREGYIGHLTSSDTSFYIHNDKGVYVRIYDNDLLFNNNDFIRWLSSSGAIYPVLSVSANNNIVIGSSASPSFVDTNIYAGEFINFYPSKTYGSTGGIQIFREYSGDYRMILRPSSNGGAYIGTTTYRWNTGFFTNQITASDLKEKDVIEDFDFKIEDFIMGLKPIAYRRTGEGDTGIRIHMGFGAQTVSELIKSIDLGDMSIVQASIVNTETVKLNDVDGEEETVIEKVEDEYDGSESVDDSKLSWGLNYNEFIAPIVLMLQKQQREISELKEEIQSLKEGS